MRRKIIAAITDMPRRQALVGVGGALLVVAGPTLLARKAAAISLIEADEKTRALYHSACGGVVDHDGLVAEARAARDGRPPASGPRAAPATVDCPVCGCKLALDDKKGERPR